ncbi:hypothetical protein C0J52_08199 [Blattella germanica]|nr:hypothetical protein C0J52_08199 [Blattella germanica]
MASNDSIGSCSLDVDATASDISECVDAGTVSARTLRSLQLSTKTPDPGGLTTDSSGGASTPEYVKRTARLFETTENAGAGNHSPRAGKTSEIPSVIVVNGSSSNKVGDNLSEVSCTGKKPSYLGLACSISGYSGITTYDSKLREGFRSRDHSPGRIGIIKSRDVSPLRSFSEQSENNLTPTYKSDCGNFLVAPLMKGSHNAEKGGNVSPRKGDSNNIPTVRPGNVSGDVSTNAGGNQIGLSHVNGDYKLVKKVNDIQIPESLRTMGDEKKYSSIVDQSVNGVSMAADDSNKRHLGSSRFAESYSGSMKEEFFSNSSSNIRESTRNFMSSMLTTDSSYSSTHYESCSIQSTSKSRDVTDFCSPLKNSPLTSVPRDGFGAFSPVKRSPDSPKTAARDSPGSRVTSSPRDSSGFSSPMKPSPDSPKTSSKDSLSAPTSTSPQKRSPGAVRVVEFTSQTKSYVRTAFVSGNSMESPFSSQGFPDSSQSKGFADGIQTTYIRNVRSGPTEGEACSDSAVAQTNGSSSDAVWTTKSFIQQRVERLYGPGALAQGFFRRVRHKPPDETQSLSEGHVSQNGTRSNSNPSLPVLRHLRPEFRAQLSLGTRRLQGCEEPCSAVEEVTSEVIDRRSSVEIPILQQQISVESLKESITDLQPAAPEVVLPIDQPQSVSCQPTGQPECSGDVVSENSQEKDGHYFLKLLKQEIDRLNGLVEVAEADLANGEALPEEALGKLRAASGQARLLIRQKLQQFEGLCHKNIAQSSEEPFPTTCEDLAGFWDMVMLQVEHVNSLFEEITKLRAANWVEVQPIRLAIGCPGMDFIMETRWSAILLIDEIITISLVVD